MSDPFTFYRHTNENISGTVKSFATPAVMALLQIILVSYAGLVAPALPPQIARWASKPLVKVLVLALILWTGNRDPGTSIGVAVAFLAVLHFAGARDRIESFEGPQTAVIPGCLNYTVYDLVESFNNDTDALFQAMVFAKVPGSLQLTDDTAGLIATYLINAGYKLKQGNCGPPQ